MGKEFFKKTTDLLQAKQKKKQWQKIVISLSLVVAMITSGLLIHPAITMERKAICGQEEHTHSAECYEKKLICDKEEHTASEVEEAAAKGETIEEHKHSDSCYKEELTCDKKEHKHSEDCYPKETEAKEETSQAKSTEETKTTEAPKAEETTEASNGEKKADEAKEETTEEKAEARTLTAKGDDYTVQVDCPAEAKIPENAELKVREIVKEKEADKEEYEAYYKNAQKALKEKEGKETDISSVRFFDITFMVDGKEIEPAAKVEVKITYDKKVEVSDQGEVKSVHFGEEKTEVLDVKTNEENGKMDEVTFDATSFSVYGIVGTELVTEVTLPGSDDTYEVTVTYGADAKIPEGVHLEVSALASYSAEYAEAKEAVIAAKSAEDEGFDESSLGFAALDISIVNNENGEKIEPADGAEVKVSFKMKSLPDNINEDDLAETLEIQHLNESTGITVVETVAEAVNVSVSEGNAETVFTVDNFSTFTITWGNVTNSTTNLRLRRGNNTRGQVVFNYVNTDGKSITRPTGVNGNTDINPGTDWPNKYEVIISSSDVAGTYTDRYYEKAYIVVDGIQREVTRILFSRTAYNSWRTDYYNGGTLVTSASGNNVTGDWRIPVYLQYSSLPNEGNTSTIHYGYMDGNTFVEFSQDDLPPTPVEITSSGSSHFAYLVYDFDGYHYADETYYHPSATTTPRADGTQTQPLLRWSGSGNKWTYTSSGDLHTYHNFNNQSDVASGSHIYVIYEKDTAIAQGGTPKVRPVNPDEEPEAPTLTKNSLNNGDGTNTISLGITGSTTKLEVEKLADVIVVFDVSTSMHLNLDGTGSYGSGAYDINGNNRIANAGRAAESLAASLLEKKNSNGDPLVRMALVPFSMTASVHSFNGSNFTTDIDEFNDAVEGLQLSSGTNWEDALMKANQLAVDPERATFVIFVTDGEPSMRVSRGSYTDAEIASENGNAAEYLARTTFYGGLSSDNTKNYDLAVPAATDIVSANKNLYTIGISSDVSTLTQLTIDSGAGADHSKTATNEDELIQAFNDIEASIIALLGAGDVKITDGITSLTNLEAKALETVDPNSFKYYRYGGWKTTTVDGEEVKTKNKYGADYEHKTEWTTREADGCAAATYDEASGSVQWNMGRNFQLEEDVTYVVEFRVWPSQTAYDLIANLDNGTKEYRIKTSDTDIKGLTQEEYDQVQYDATTDSYSLKTNTEDVGAKYTLCTKTGVTVSYEDDAEEKQVNYEEGTIENMDLMSELMTIKKEWAHEFNDSHAGDQVKFYLKVGEAGYYQNDGTVSPSEANADSLVLSNPDWVQSIYIAPGMMDYDSATGEVHLLESGHEYELYEYEITQADSSDNYIASYDFISEIVRPMRVNGDLKYLVKYTSASEIPDGVTETYTIDGKTYYARPGSGDSGLLSGTNYRRAEMDITKIINKGTFSMTEEQLNKEVFTYRVTLRMPADANLSLITGWQFVYRPDNPNWTIQGYQAEDEPLAGDETRFAGNNFRRGTFNYNGTPIGEAVVTDPDDEGYVTITMDLSMYPNQVLRLTNLPMGTEYRIEEVYANNRTLGSNGLMSNASVVPTTSVESNLAAQGYTQISSASKYGTASGNVISGTIDNPNRRYYNQFTNTIDNIAAVDLQVTKHLDGYTWSGERYYFTLEAGVHKDVDGTEVGTSPLPASTSLYLSNTTGSDDRSYGFGSVKYNEEGTYTYTVKEARYRSGDSTTIVDIDQTADTIPDTNIVFEKPVTITVTVSKNADGSLYVEKVEGTRTELTGTVINTTFTNSQPCYVKILKVGDSTTPLSEVQFTVYSDSDLTTLVTTDAKGEPVGSNGVITTDGDGYASLGAMLSGATYYLVETDTVGGYNKLSKPVVITFNGTSVTASCDQDGVIFNSPEWIYQDEDDIWVVKINNSSGVELPNTGGPGTLLYTLSGIALMLGAALMYGFRLRRRERRLN